MNGTHWSSRSSVVAAVLLAAAAGGCAEPGLDATGPDVGVQPGADAGVLPPCSSALEGTEPFGRPLRGSATFAMWDGRTRQDSLDVQVYFPAGRVPGAPVLFAFEWWEGGIATVSSVLDSGRSASLDWSGNDGRDLHVTGTLAGPAEGVRAHVGRNFADWNTDVTNSGSAEMTLCPEGSLPQPAFRVSEGHAPDSYLEVRPNAPLDTSNARVSAKRGNGSQIAVDAQVGAESIIVTPHEGVFPPGEQIHLAIEARDAIGRAFPQALVVSPAAEQAAPAFVTTVQRTTDRVDGLVALGDRGAATLARVTASWSSNCSDLRLTVVAADGGSARATIAEGTTSFDGSLALPGTGKQWLSVHAKQVPWKPQWAFIDSCRITVSTARIE